MNRRKTLLILVAVMAGCTAAKPAFAGPITWGYTGVVKGLYDANNLVGDAVTVGSPFAGFFTFESTTPGNVTYRDAITAIGGVVGGVSFFGTTGPNNFIWVRNDADAGNFVFDDYSVAADIDLLGEPLTFSLFLRDTTGTAFSTNALLLSPPELDLFDSTGLGFISTSEDFNLAVQLLSLSVIPEPSTFLLLGIGGLALLKRLRSSRRGSEAKRQFPRLSLLLAVTAMGGLGIAGTVRASDCNNNGIVDANELTSCPAIDVVFLIDTSGSLATAKLVEICAAIKDPDVVDDATDILTQGGLTVNAEILRIGAATSETIEANCPCCTGRVPDVYCVGPQPPGSPCERLDGCPGGTVEQRFEDWANATAVVAANKVWGNGPRIIVPISDEGPRCGDPINDPGDDRDAIENAIPIVANQRVIVGPVIDKNVTGLEQLAQDLADSGDRELEQPLLSVTKSESAGVPALATLIPFLLIPSGETR